MLAADVIGPNLHNKAPSPLCHLVAYSVSANVILIFNKQVVIGGFGICFASELSDNLSYRGNP